MSTTDETILNEELQTTDSTNEWEQKYKELQKDYTKKSQELSSLKKQPTAPETDDEEALSNLDKLLKDRGRDKTEEIEKKLLTKFKEEQAFEKLLESEPELQKFSSTIKKIAETEGLAYDEVITKYDFASSDRLKKAKERSLLGSRKLFDEKPKTLSDLSPAEYEIWKKENLSGNMFSKTKNI